MRRFAVLVFAISLAAPAIAQDLGTQAPVKAPQSYPENVPDQPRQGGDTIASALVIPGLPYHDTGTTAGYTDDYDEVCPYSGSLSPDVVYRFVALASFITCIDLCGSAYDTKVYVYDAGLNLIACNDDFYFGAPCGVYVSKIEQVQMVAGFTYYIVVDGYASAFGAYNLDVGSCCPGCVVPCPTNGHPEGEPPLVDEYVDHHNGGCNTPGFPFQSVSADSAGALVLCGESGWYHSNGGQMRDTDWYILTAGPTEDIEVTADAEYATYFFELGPQDCAVVAVLQQITAGPCAAATMTISGYAHGASIWFWAGPTVFAPPGDDDMYDYVVWLSGLVPVATAATTWGAVKSLYD